MAPTRVAIMQIGYDHPWNADPPRTLGENIELADGYLAKAADARADIVIAPECWPLVGLRVKTAKEMARAAERIPGDGPIYAMFRRHAERANAHVVGWNYERDGERLYNTAFILSPQGEFVGRYRKTHPVPGPETVEHGITPGEELPVFDLPFGRVGIMICFDNYHAEVPRVLAVKGARLIIYPTMNSPRHVLATLTPARAIDSGVFVASSVVLGNRVAEGFAAIYDPRGEVVASPGRRDGVAVGEIDLELPYSFSYDAAQARPELADHRRWLLSTRRPHLYGSLTDDAVL